MVGAKRGGRWHVTETKADRPALPADPLKSDPSLASAVARLQAERGEVLTVRGASGLLAADATLRTLVGLLDGSRDAPRLLRDWQRALGVNAAPHPDALERALRLLAGQGLLAD